MTGTVTGAQYAADMARNSELVRQWEILRDVDAARTGIGIAKLANMRAVHPRTIRRDLDALVRAGFPLFDEKVTGTSMWKLRAKPFRGLEQLGLSVTELCAVYFGRTILASSGVILVAEPNLSCRVLPTVFRYRATQVREPAGCCLLGGFTRRAKPLISLSRKRVSRVTGLRASRKRFVSFGIEAPKLISSAPWPGTLWGHKRRQTQEISVGYYR